jgi:hypothetical protein
MRLVRPFTLTLAGAALIATMAGSQSFAEGLIRAEARTATPEAAPVLDRASPAVNAVFLDYADDAELLLNARLAMLRYPGMSAEILALYGTEPEFRAILRRFGPAVMPPIQYFLTHRVDSLAVMQATGRAIDGTGAAISDWWHGRSASEDEAAPAVPELGPSRRGWYAVNFINQGGHDFLGQFRVGEASEVTWVQTERLTEGISRFFTSGIRSLETSLRTEGAATTQDYLWAGLDLAIVLGTAKLLRAGRGASRTPAAAAGGRVSRASLTAGTVSRGTRAALRVGRWGVPIAVGYAVIRHPSLISGLGARAAALLGLPAWPVQFVIWSLVLWPVIWLLSRLWRWLLRPTARVCIVTGRGLRRLSNRRRQPRHPATAPPQPA